MKRVLLVHGYNGVPEMFKSFKAQLEAAGCEVAMPDFPVREEISVEAYFRVFDQYRDFIGPDCAVIAHSIGNGMLLKYLFANRLKLGRFISLAGFAKPFVNEDKDVLNEKVALIDLSGDEIKHARETISKSFCIFSNNDHIVPYEILLDFPQLIGGEMILIDNIGHMGHKAGITDIPGVSALANESIAFDFSCGCIVINGDKMLFEKEISSSGDRFWAFPKGHVEGSETEIEAAIRETKEEVGIDVEITSPEPIMNSYIIRGGTTLKRVVHFLARPVGNTEPKIQTEEVEEARWLSFDEARELASFESTKLAIDAVKEMLK